MYLLANLEIVGGGKKKWKNLCALLETGKYSEEFEIIPLLHRYSF